MKLVNSALRILKLQRNGKLSAVFPQRFSVQSMNENVMKWKEDSSKQFISVKK